MAEDLTRILRNTLHRNEIWESQLNGNRFVFTAENQLKCLTCQEEDPDDDDMTVDGRRMGLKNFDRINIGGPFVVTIEQSDKYRVVVEGEDQDADEVDFDVNGSELTVNYRNKDFPELFGNRDKIKIFISLPDLKGLDLAGATNATVKGFHNLNDVDLQLAGAVKAEMELDAEKVTLNLDGASQLELRGKANRLEAEVTSASKLNAFEFETEDAEVEANSSALAEVNAKQHLNAEASSAGRVRYRGNADVESNTSSAGSVRREE